MHWDALGKRAFPFVICALVAAVAYFQARGVGALVAAEVQPTPGPTAAPGLPPRAALDAPVADSILERNPFDSEAEARAAAASEPDPTPEEPIVAGGASEKCDVGYVTLITGSEDPAWSFASISPKSGESRLVRIGDDIQGHRVARIGWRRIWLEVGGKRCVMKLGDKPEVKKPTPRLPAKKKRRARRRGAPKISAAMKSKIHKVSATEYRVERSIVDEILQKQAELMRYTRARPARNGNGIAGMRMSRISAGTLLHELGIRNGDVIQSVNGFDLTNPQKALEAYGRLRTANGLSLQIERRGKPTTIEYQFQ